LKKSAEFGTDLAVLEQGVDNMVVAWDLTPETIQQVKNLANRMFDLGIIKKIPDIDAMIDLQFLKNAPK